MDMDRYDYDYERDAEDMGVWRCPGCGVVCNGHTEADAHEHWCDVVGEPE